jgi:hypothetical protein
VPERCHALPALQRVPYVDHVDGTSGVVLIVVAAIAVLYILYWVIRLAIRDALKEAWGEDEAGSPRP